MATCPNCKGHLTDGHRCPRRRAYVVAEIIACGFAGGLAGLMLCAVVTTRDDMDAMGILAGAVVAITIDRLLRN